MNLRRSAIVGIALVLALLVMPGARPGSAWAQADKGAQADATEKRIERFAGAWVGKTTGETSVERKATLTIDAVEDGGFTITWTSFEAPTKSDSGIIRRERQLAFVPTETPGLFRATGANDPVNDLAAWAWIDGDVLSVSTIAVQPDGRLERQIYDRTLTGDDLYLSYRRYLDADVVRTIEAEFVRL